MKAGGAAATAAAGILLVVTDFDQELGGDQTEHTFFMMRVLFVALPLVCLLTAIVLNHFYPLTKARMAAIRVELEERRGSV